MLDHPIFRLLDEETQQRLPKLYSGEQLGMEAKAQVKFVSPLINWIWYASEFDGNDLFFGLVIGFESELGYFSLSDLVEAQAVQDRQFQPTTLAQLKHSYRR